MSTSRFFNTLFCFAFISFIALNPKAQNALDFDGIDDVAIAANASSLIANGNFSMAAWVYPTNPAAGWPNFDGMVGFRNDSNADLYFLQLSSTNMEVRFRNSSGSNFDIVYNGLALNTWNHFAATYDGSMLRLYHNGAAVAMVAANGAITNTTSSLYLGSLPFQSNDFDFDGRLDDVCLWNRALSPAEVSTWYTACTPNLSDPGLQLAYQFNQGVAGANNAGITSAIDSKGNINASLTGFLLNGTTSNFIAFGNPTLTTLNDSASCSYTSPSGNFVWDSTGNYRDTLTNSIGCDSIISVDLVIVSGDLDTTFSVSECDSYTSPSGNYTWTNTGTFQDTLVSSAGCDSILTINLTIDLNSTATTSETACGSFTSPSGAFIWTTSGTYPDTISNAAGCDSILVVNLTINNVDTGVTQNGISLTANAVGASYQWVNCDINFTPIPAQTNQTFSPGANGNYAVIVTENGCTDTSTCISVVVVSQLDPLHGLVVSTYPNPNSGKFSVQLSRTFLDVQAKVFDPTGKKWGALHTSNTDQLTLELDAPDGLYFVELEMDGIKTVVKIIKQAE